MDAMLALVTIAGMVALTTISGMLLTRMFKTIRDLRGITTGLNDTMRWAIGQVSATERNGPGPAIADRVTGRPKPSP